MREENKERATLVTEAKANALYLVVYLPIALSVLAALGAGLPYLLLGATPWVELHGAQIVAWGAYILVCLLVAMTVASVAWLRAVRGTVSRNQAERIMMPMGSDPIGRWLVARHISADNQSDQHGA